jgi:hypothetical protein
MMLIMSVNKDIIIKDVVVRTIFLKKKSKTSGLICHMDIYFLNNSKMHIAAKNVRQANDNYSNKTNSSLTHSGHQNYAVHIVSPQTYRFHIYSNVETYTYFRLRVKIHLYI